MVTSTLKDPSSRDRFLELSRGTKSWLEACPGFLRYELFEGVDGGWTDTMTWADADAAAAGNRAFAQTALAEQFAEIVEPTYLTFAGNPVALG